MDRKTAEREARRKTVAQMKAELGLDRTVRGHTHWLRDKIVQLWVEMVVVPVPVLVPVRRVQRRLFD